MNNSEFRRLLLTNDKELITSLSKNKKKSSAGKERDGKGKGKGKGKMSVEEAFDKGLVKGSGKGKKGKGKAGDQPTGGQAPGGPQYRDRAEDRRKQKGEYETIAQEFESHGQVEIEQSKYLGGDLDHTHLVKGLDFSLLSKVRNELTKQHKMDEIQEHRAARKAGKHEKKAFVSELGKRVWHSAVETLHPHHSGFERRLRNMGKALALGQRIRGAPSMFLPGRMYYEFDTDTSFGSSDIPRTVFASKEDAPSVDKSKWVAPVLPDTVQNVREALQRAAEEKKQRKRNRATQGENAPSTYTVAQKIVTTHKAKDDDNDIFAGVGTFDPAEVLRRAKAASQASQRSRNGAKEERKASYFDDAGAEKYKKAPEGQLEMADVQLDETEQAQEDVKDKAAGDAKVAFEPAERFQGPRPGWVFKTGPQGLGYYAEGSAVAKDRGPIGFRIDGDGKPARNDKDKDKAKKRRKVQEEPGSDDDAYGECFPGAGLGNAMVSTGTGLDDQDEEEVKKGSKLGAGGKRIEAGAEKQGKKTAGGGGGGGGKKKKKGGSDASS